MKCPSCDSEDIDYDPARGDASCIECGVVLEQNLIVNEVGFSEDARGRSNVIGTHIRADGRINSFGALRGFSREATEITMQHGRRRLGHLVSALKLQSRHTDSALRLFRLAVERNFHKGRKMANVCCACLYVVCRMEKTPHMLLDFSDVLETNLYMLGHTFLKFARLLCIQLPVIDPSLYIHRFADKLEFGDRKHNVAMSALRVIARMQRNWLSEGRRPSGLCGAALMIAAKMHNFHRTQADVARVVRIGNVALKERLMELHKTPTAALTVAQVDEGGGDDGKSTSLRPGTSLEASDPPAFQRLVAKRVQRVKKRKRTSDGTPNSVQTTMEEGTTNDMGKTGSQNVKLTPGKEGRTAEDERLEGEIEAALASEEFQELDREAIAQESSDTVMKGQDKETAISVADYASVQKAMEFGILDETVVEKDELSDLDEEDAGRYLNTEEEYERKKELWTEVNKDYLEKQERLEQMRKERPDDYRKLRPQRGGTQKKRRTSGPRKPRANTREEAETPAPPIATPKSSKKLNYSVLNALEDSEDAGLSTSPVTAPQ